ncbi:MAG: caspase family protein [Pseudomonadota bacterium]
MVISILSAALSSARADAQDAPARHALIIGINDYERARDLNNAVHDARAIAGRLDALGFSIFSGGALENPTRAHLIAAMRGFAAQLPEGAVAVVYFAGHGLALGGNSYLIPANDSLIVSRDDVHGHAVALRTLTGRLAGRPGVIDLVLIDACQANGLRGSGATALSGAGAAGDLVAGADGATTLVYAAAPGQIALDGDGDHSPFADAILSALEEPDPTLDAALGSIARETHRLSDGAQTVWTLRTYGAVDAPFFVP